MQYTVKNVDIWKDKQVVLGCIPSIGDTIRFSGWGDTKVVAIYNSAYERGAKFVRVNFYGHVISFRLLHS